jgi:hypothetical protein
MTRILVVLALARVAAAEPPGLTVAPPGLAPVVELPAPPPLEPSYRGQTAIVDGVALGLFFIAISTNDEPVGYLSLGAYVGGAPLVHLAHHRPGHAAGSLALRVGLPFVGGLLGEKLGEQTQCSGINDGTCASGGRYERMGLGIIGGMIAAMVIDTAVLAKGDEAPAPASWSPAIAARRDGITLGFSGSF